MGIPGLARHLEPYTTHSSLEKLKGHCAIIDGPALAYYAHRCALAVSAGRSATPSYAEIVVQGISWLDSLENIGIKVSMIFFDGALLTEKRPERLSRMEQNNKSIRQLRASYSSEACPIPLVLGSKLYAFLAPALQEALMDSPFASRTCVVPGEADDWCAQHARKHERSIIFTCDTDLVLFEYAPDTFVSFFQDADLSMGIRAYSPKEIQHKLQLNSLVSFAFVVGQNPLLSTKTLVRQAQEVNKDSKKFTVFRKRYAYDSVQTDHCSNMPILMTSSANLDVRVSEFVYQCHDDAAGIFVYLPLLAEDPNQASAWAVGQDVRTLAYSLLAPQNSNIYEHKRKAQSIVVEKIHPYATADVQTLALELDQQISALVEWVGPKAVEPKVIWHLFALSLVLTKTNSPITMYQILRVFNADFDSTWSFVQSTARIHAAVYSFRMLKQITKVWLATKSKPDSSLLECLHRLDEHFKTLPSIAAMFMVPGQMKTESAHHDELRKLVGGLCDFIGERIPEETGSSKKNKKKKKKKKK